MQAIISIPAETHALASDLTTLSGFMLKRSGSDFYRTMADLDLSFTQVAALGALDLEDGELSVKELAAALSVSLATASRVVEALHGRGLVERREDERDRRMKQVRITAAGRAIPVRVHGARLAAVAAFVETLTPAQRRRLAAAITPLVARPDVAACRAKRAGR